MKIIDALNRLGYETFVEPNSKNTYENALYSCSIIKELNPEKVHVVTDTIHFYRTKIIFEKIFGENIEFHAVETPHLIKALAYEFFSLPSYLLLKTKGRFRNFIKELFSKLLLYYPKD